MRRLLTCAALMLMLIATAHAKVRPIARGNYHVNPGGFISWKIEVHGDKTAGLFGGYTANTDVEFFIFLPDDFEKWQRGESFSYIFASGRTRGTQFNGFGLDKGNYVIVVS